MDNDFTKSLLDGNLLDQLDPYAESMSKGIKKGIEDVSTALLDQTNNDKKLSDEVKSSLEKLRASLKDASEKARAFEAGSYDVSISSTKAFLKYSLSLVDYADNTCDTDLGSFNTFGNEYLTEDFGISNIDFNHPDGKPRTLTELDRGLKTMGYDKFWRALPDRIAVDYRINGEVIPDDDLADVSTDVSDANKALSKAVENIQTQVNDRDSHRIFYKDYDAYFTGYERSKFSATTNMLFRQNKALERGWDPARIDDLQLLTVARSKVLESEMDPEDNPELSDITDKVKNFIEYSGLFNSSDPVPDYDDEENEEEEKENDNDKKKEIDKEDIILDAINNAPDGKIYTDRLQFEHDYQALCDNITDWHDAFNRNNEMLKDDLLREKRSITVFRNNSVYTPNDLNDAMNELLADNNYRKMDLKNPGDDKRSATYLNMVLSIKLLKHIKNEKTLVSSHPIRS